MCQGIVTEDIVRWPDRMAEVSRGRSVRASGEGPNDRKDHSYLGLDAGIALAIPLRRALGGHSAAKPQRRLTREVKPTRGPQTTNAQPTNSSVRLTYRTAVCGPACTVAWQGRTGARPPYADWD